MKLQRLALLGCLTAGLLFSSLPAGPVFADTTVQVTAAGATVTAHGTYQKNGVPLSGAPAFLTVTGSDGTIYFADQFDTGSNGNYQIEWTMPSFAQSGTYTVKVSVDGDVQTALFDYTATPQDNGGGSNPQIDDGPIRFTGELNGGSSQAVIYNSDTGLNQTGGVPSNSVTLDLNKSLTVIDEAPSGTQYLTISVPDPTANDTTVTVPSRVIKQMQNLLGTQSHLLVATNIGSYDLPLNALHTELLNMLQADANGSLSFHIGLANPDESDPVQLAALSATDLKDPNSVSFDLSAFINGQTIPIKDFGNTFVRYSIDLAGSTTNSGATQSALLVSPKTGTLLPAPSTYYHDAVGHAKLVITRTGNGTYFPIEASRSFNDVPFTDNKAQIEKLAAKGVISGTSLTTFNPDGPITRAQFATLMVRALGLSDKQGSTLFSDVPSNSWYGDYVNIGSSLGLISGYSSYEFAPNDPITTEQMAALLARGLQFVQTRPYVDTARVLSPLTDQSSISSWARDDVALALQTGIIDPGTTTLQPQHVATRAESAKMLYNLLQYLKFI